MNRLRPCIDSRDASAPMPVVRTPDICDANPDSVPNTVRPACCRGVRGLCTVDGRLRTT